MCNFPSLWLFAKNRSNICIKKGDAIKLNPIFLCSPFPPLFHDSVCIRPPFFCSLFQCCLFPLSLCVLSQDRRGKHSSKGLKAEGRLRPLKEGRQQHRVSPTSVYTLNSPREQGTAGQLKRERSKVWDGYMCGTKERRKKKGKKVKGEKN